MSAHAGVCLWNEKRNEKVEENKWIFILDSFLIQTHNLRNFSSRQKRRLSDYALSWMKTSELSSDDESRKM